jgi:hypothetical protein
MSKALRQPTWLVMPADRDGEEEAVEALVGWVCCLRCRKIYRYEHHCLMPPVPSPAGAIYDQLFEEGGWRSCLRCRSIYHEYHECPGPAPPRPPRPAKPVPTGAFDEFARSGNPGYGYKMGRGFWAMYGQYDGARPVRNRWRGLDWLPHSEMHSAKYETGAEADYWREWRCRNIFLSTVHELARTAIQQRVASVGVQPHEPGSHYPSSHQRYRIIGAAKGFDREIEIDLGFWVGPWNVSPYLEFACEAAERAVTKRWPRVRVGFSWGKAGT